ncbi:MAG: DMT family transporter [Deltaproteobacteria bacterium]|nr:DMT family transporter [Deltaproteobacteria bacterium]
MPRSDVSVGTLELLVGAFVISFSAVFVRLAHVGPTMAGFYRTFFGGLVLAAFTVARGEPLWRGRVPALWATVAGILFAVDLSCWHRSIHFIGPGLATILGNFQVFFLAAVGLLVFRERPSWRFFVSVPLAVGGLLLLVGLDWESLGPSYRSGLALGFATALAYTGYTLSLRHSRGLAGALTPAANLTGVSLVTAAIMGLEATVQGESFHIPDARTWGCLLAYGALCQALGWVAISRGIAKVPASRVGLLLLLQPMLTFVWDIVLFDRPTSAVEMGGAFLTVGAIYLGSTAQTAKGREPALGTLPGAEG